MTQGYGTVSECLDGCTPFVYGSSTLPILSFWATNNSNSSFTTAFHRGARAATASGSGRRWGGDVEAVL